MPQLDPTSFASQLFWLTISFVILYVLLARVFLPRVQSVLSHRAGTLAGNIEAATRMQKEAGAAHTTYEKALAEARLRSQALLAEAQHAIAARAAASQSVLDKDIEKKLADAEASIRVAKQDVMAKLTPVSGELATLIVEALVHHKPSAKSVGTVINELSKERMV